MRTLSYYTLIFFLLFCLPVYGQSQLKPGFDAEEYLEMLRISSRQFDSITVDATPAPFYSEIVFKGKATGLDNRWELWISGKNKGVISLRGTTAAAISWMENFYAAMQPATGTLRLHPDSVFTYKLAENPRAQVHTGWLIGLAHLAPSIVEKIQEYYAKGIKEFILFGHSQGGALAFLLRSHLHYLQQDGKIPADIVFKTYCSAAPKPGNLYYAYDFDFITRNGWAYTVVNAQDWVPETPFSIQTLSDFNAVNPFSGVEKTLKKQRLPVRWYIGRIYRKMDKSTRKAEREFRKHLGHTLYGQVKKALPDFPEPEYAEGSNYMRAGIPVVLLPDEAYRKEFPDDKEKVFMHHGFWPYYLLVQKWYVSDKTAD